MHFYIVMYWYSFRFCHQKVNQQLMWKEVTIKHIFCCKYISCIQFKTIISSTIFFSSFPPFLSWNLFHKFKELLRNSKKSWLLFYNQKCWNFPRRQWRLTKFKKYIQSAIESKGLRFRSTFFPLLLRGQRRKKSKETNEQTNK